MCVHLQARFKLAFACGGGPDRRVCLLALDYLACNDGRWVATLATSFGGRWCDVVACHEYACHEYGMVRVVACHEYGRGGLDRHWDMPVGGGCCRGSACCRKWHDATDWDSACCRMCRRTIRMRSPRHICTHIGAGWGSSRRRGGWAVSVGTDTPGIKCTAEIFFIEVWSGHRAFEVDAEGCGVARTWHGRMRWCRSVWRDATGESRVGTAPW